MSAVSDILFVVSVLREYGVPVTFEPDWETRGNGQQTDGYDGSLIHHTAIPASYTNPAPGTRVLRDGRPDLDGPLCQGQVKFTGGVHIIAAQPANHAGASGGPSMGPLPVTRLFNPRVMGWEVDYAGNSPMSPEQYRTCLIIAIATQRLRNRPSLEWTRAHAETSIEGKWDPGWAPGRTIDMGAFRQDAATLHLEDDLSGQGDNLLAFIATGGPDTQASQPGAPAGAIDPTSLFGRVLQLEQDQAVIRDQVANLHAALMTGGSDVPTPLFKLIQDIAAKVGA